MPNPLAPTSLSSAGRAYNQLLQCDHRPGEGRDLSINRPEILQHRLCRRMLVLRYNGPGLCARVMLRATAFAPNVARLVCLFSVGLP